MKAGPLSEPFIYQVAPPVNSTRVLFRHIAGPVRPLDFDEAKTLARSKAIALKIFVGHAPHGASGRRKHQLFNWHAQETDAGNIGKSVVMVDEAVKQPQKVDEEQEIQNRKSRGADEHGRDQVAAEEGNHEGAS